MAVNLAQIVRDIRTVASAIDRLWDENVAPAGVRADADTIRRQVDERALARVVAFLLDHDEPDAAQAGAKRLDAALRHLTAKQRAAIQKQIAA